MQKSLIFVILITVFFGCHFFQAPDLLLDDFEGEISQATIDFGSSQNSQIEVQACRENKLCGQQSLKLSYQLDTSGYMWAARGYNLDVKGAGKWLVEPAEINWNRYKSISAAVYGQNSGAIYAFDIRDRGGEIWRYIIDDQFEGWRELVLPFDNFFVRRDWQPEDAKNNQVLDFPIESFQFEPLFPGERTIYFDCLKLTARTE